MTLHDGVLYMSLNGLVPTYLDNNFCLRSNYYNFYILTISKRIVAYFWIIPSAISEGSKRKLTYV